MTDSLSSNLIDQLFKHESGKIVSVLVRLLGPHNLQVAQEIVQETLCSAFEVWRLKGLPENPTAWLYKSAKNSAIDYIRHKGVEQKFDPDYASLLSSEYTLSTTVDTLFGSNEIEDEQLRMIFSCCHPNIDAESQIALILNILCGLGVSEIASAFLASEAAVEKRMSRAKKVFRDSGKLPDVTNKAEIHSRLDAVHTAIYLLFNEGYHSSRPNESIRDELCFEAMRLCLLVTQKEISSTSASNALMSLMCLLAARLKSRFQSGRYVQLYDQDRGLWDQQLINVGLVYLAKALEGEVATEYHFQAMIAAKHATAASIETTEWSEIVTLYDGLLKINPSPIIELNRAIAVGYAHGPEQGLRAIESIQSPRDLFEYPFYYAAVAEFHGMSKKINEARKYFKKAMEASRNETERSFFEARLVRFNLKNINNIK